MGCCHVANVYPQGRPCRDRLWHQGTSQAHAFRVLWTSTLLVTYIEPNSIAASSWLVGFEDFWTCTELPAPGYISSAVSSSCSRLKLWSRFAGRARQKSDDGGFLELLGVVLALRPKHRRTSGARTGQHAQITPTLPSTVDHIITGTYSHVGSLVLRCVLA